MLLALCESPSWKNLEHPQLPTPIQMDNGAASDIANDAVPAKTFQAIFWPRLPRTESTFAAGRMAALSTTK